MKFIQIFLCIISCSTVLQSCRNSSTNEKEHHTVYFETGRFGGWPANHGIWNWDNEILVGFGIGYYKDLGEERHNIDRDKPEEHVFARSLDGGETWSIEDPSKDGIMIARGKALHGIEPDHENLKSIVPLKEPMDFTRPGFVMKFWMLSSSYGASIFYYSYDKGHSWEGPFNLEVGNINKIAARVDYIIEDKDSCLAFFTVAKSDHEEGRVICSRTDDGGLTWQFVSWVGSELKNGFRIMPSTVRNSENELILTSRVRIEDKEDNVSQKNQKNRYIDSWLSNNNGENWKYLGKPVDDLGEGNPPSLIKLKDGRLCLTYGYRAKPYSICAKISQDNGRTWSEEIILRDDGAGRDMGYVRSVQRPDGKIVTIYYFQDRNRPERYIACTIWDPNVNSQ